ncbi:MAG TPA: hypothetical protein VNW97_00780 [Candidatus Saccharimonadales bacterium]|jgi:hypothetical protein|nr:hypothetical protein [Candidatus Saccharimonadales bacterium]
MLRKAIAPLFLLIISAACAQTPEAPAAEDAVSHDALLRRVKDRLLLFPPDERATLLIHLVNARPDDQSSEAGELTLEIFHLTRELRSIERMDVEAKALMAYSRPDSAGALKLLPLMEISTSPGNGYSFREKAAGRVFKRFLDDHPDEIVRVRDTMRMMGENGIFPFHAAASVVRREARRSQPQAAEIVRDAVKYYSRSPRTHFFDMEFASFMVESAKYAPAAITKEGLRPLVTAILNMHGEMPAAWGSSFAEPEKPGTHRGAAEAVLASLLPLLQSVDPEWAMRLEQEHPALASARFKNGRKAKSAAAELFSVIADPEDEPDDRTMPQSALNEIHALTAEDGEKALRIRAGIQDASWRAAAGADIAVMMNSINPQRANRLLEEAERQAKRSADPQNKLRITAALGHAYLKLRRPEAFAAALARMFRLADETFARFSHEAPKCAWASLPGARELAPLTREAATYAPQMVLEQINAMQAPLLQTHLLISMMEGMQAKPEQ